MRNIGPALLAVLIAISASPLVAGSPSPHSAIPDPSSTTSSPSPSSSAPNPLIQEMVDAMNRWSLYSLDYQLTNISAPDRKTGSTRYMNALNFLRDEVTTKGQQGHVRVEYEPFTHQSAPIRNILVFVEGNDPVKKNERVYLSGHPDTVANAPGANDDGSGTSIAMLGCIIASKYVLNRTLVCGGWDAEEIGLVGSDKHASNASNSGVKIHGVLTMDMVGYDTENSRQIYARDYTRSKFITDTVLQANTDYGIGLNIVRQDAATIDSRSDHVSFNKYAFPAIVFRQKQVWDLNPNYHKPSDTIDTLNLQTWEMTAKAAIAAVATMAEPTGKYGSGAVDNIKVTPPSASITVGQTQQFSATAFDANGNPVGATFAWAASGGSVNTAGLYSTTAPGTFTVYANASGKTGTATVTVAASTLAKIDVTPVTATVKAGATAQFTAKGTDNVGNPVPITPTWAATGGTVDATGMFTGQLIGTFTVTASQSGVSGSAQVTVTVGDPASLTVDPPTATIRADATAKFTASVRDSQGNVIAGAQVVWSAVEGTVDTTGLYTPSKTGTWKVQAVSGSLSAEATVTVTPGPLAEVEITPVSADVEIDAKQQFSFKAFDG
ncbi:MAG TPA: M28 family peptidase, partial [Thermoplasmata archaeon]|nr:M28 family peptidase [Thermoplasmata archaeon]